MRKVDIPTKKPKVSGRVKRIVAAPAPNLIADAITPEELGRRADLKRIFDEIEAGRRRTKKLPKGVTIDSLIREGRRY
jgi:hypothetical protein